MQSQGYQIYQWCGNSNQNDPKVVLVIFTKRYVRKCANIFTSYSVPKFQVHFLVQSQEKTEEKGNCKRVILRASEQLRWLRTLTHIKENTIPYKNQAN